MPRPDQVCCNLEVVSECVVESAAEDERGCELSEGEVELGSSFPAGVQASLVVQPGVRSFDRPAVPRLCVADPSGSGLSFARDQRSDAALSERVAEPVSVVAAVGEEAARPVLVSAASDAQARYRVDRGERVHAVVPVSGRDKQRQGDATAVADELEFR
jgi:hypothetical protein